MWDNLDHIVIRQRPLRTVLLRWRFQGGEWFWWLACCQSSYVSHLLSHGGISDVVPPLFQLRRFATSWRSILWKLWRTPGASRPESTRTGHFFPCIISPRYAAGRPNEPPCATTFLTAWCSSSPPYAVQPAISRGNARLDGPSPARLAAAAFFPV